ncbi:inorganic phosphate transporter [Gloeobacter kilaueensis]|uniref:Phosphate transporter n=1 Tax=Gloeobacter kilaueensis (strain ATCC BAA-2537 / CCAP 1431/1 / ULC 316 / JS1) TaxID=1183438 RepID=U5QS92_GLOK1|nr:inorganic phosphate transporter [Gloeobacter kilaueensis]AGY60575.1 phosphate transporter [Gloeobacter kilaueensis JS1]
MQLFGETLTASTGLLLLLALGLALSFEFVNGFHDTANAVATVIYTHTLKPTVAVVWSGLWNLIGVLTSAGTVAFGIIALLPVELVLNVGSGAGFAMVFALLISAIIWNLGTWYLGLPASSSHTLIGSIMGVGLANSLMSPGYVFGEGVNWNKAGEVFTSLLVSPIVGFSLAALLLILARNFLSRQEALFKAPEGEQPPPFWIRSLLILTCTGVSFAHGSNDGQKGMGLILLILIGILPGAFALNLGTDPATLQKLLASSQSVVSLFEERARGTTLPLKAAEVELSSFLKTGQATEKTYAALAAENRSLSERLTGKSDLAAVARPDRIALRSDIYLVGESVGKLLKKDAFSDPGAKKALKGYKEELDGITKFIPDWVKVTVAIALGLGTMIGWKRIVVTVGEKIGKEHLTYAQGASAELVAMGTILAADNLGLPVSTTHVLSSGVAGTMFANKSGLQTGTLRNLLLAWVLTLPVCILLGAATFAANLYVIFNLLGIK